jgi:hypothetical protein
MADTMARLLLGLLLLCALLISSAAADEMQIFDLKGATPQEMIPLIKPFVGPDGTVTGMHNQLIVRTTPERMIEVRKILLEFDRPPRRLLIHVRDTAPSESAGDRIGLSVKNPHLQIGETEKNSLELKRYTTESRQANQRTLQTVEGQPTLISSGIIRPEVTRSGYIIGPRGGYQTSVDYRNIDSGFYARVQVVRDRVRIEISTRKQEPISGSPVINHQETENVVSGQLGEWLPLARTRTQRQLKSSGIGSYASTESVNEEALWVKVELLPD